MDELKAFFALLVTMSTPTKCLAYKTIGLLTGFWVFQHSHGSCLGTFICDNTKMPKPGDRNFDKLSKVRQFIDDLKTNFQINYAPHRQQAVDEAMINIKATPTSNNTCLWSPSSMGSKCGVGQTAPMGRHSKDFNMDLVTQLSLSCVKP